MVAAEPEPRSFEAEQRSPTEPIHAAPGPYPKDPMPAKNWKEGADLIRAYPLRYGITSPDRDPLGPRSGDPERRHERIQQRLEHEGVQMAERAFEIEFGGPRAALAPCGADIGDFFERNCVVR